jgi:hypothetical protein
MGTGNNVNHVLGNSMGTGWEQKEQGGVKDAERVAKTHITGTHLKAEKPTSATW